MVMSSQYRFLDRRGGPVAPFETGISNDGAEFTDMTVKKPLTLAMAVAALGAGSAAALEHKGTGASGPSGTAAQCETAIALCVQAQGEAWGPFSREVFEELSGEILRSEEDRIIVAGGDDGDDGGFGDEEEEVGEGEEEGGKEPQRRQRR